MATIDTFMSETSRLIAGYSAAIGKAFMSFFGGIGALLELYNIYSVVHNEEVAQRKTKISTYMLGFGINVFYTAAAITGKILSYLGLGLVGLAAEIVALSRTSYVLHESRRLTQKTEKIIQELIHQYNPLALDANDILIEIQILQAKLEEQRDFRFKNKVDTAYTIVSVIASGLFIAGLFVTPLLIASFAIFTVAKILQAYDTYNNYKLSRWLCNLITDKPAQALFDANALLQHQMAAEPEENTELTPPNSPSSTATIFIAANFTPIEAKDEAYGIEILAEPNKVAEEEVEERAALQQEIEEVDELDGVKIPLLEERRFSLM
ncbi:MAG: hypothetical protein P4M14_00390 [Gammaproteobacteria bacterium]|nr:hypothetical protein [Gammaproteobacteria bacterium]